LEPNCSNLSSVSEPSVVATTELATQRCFAWARLVAGYRPIADLSNQAELDSVRRIATVAAARIVAAASGRTIAGQAEG